MRRCRRRPNPRWTLWLVSAGFRRSLISAVGRLADSVDALAAERWAAAST